MWLLINSVSSVKCTTSLQTVLSKNNKKNFTFLFFKLLKATLFLVDNF